MAARQVDILKDWGNEHGKSHLVRRLCHGKANENFPRHSGGAVVLDGIWYFDELAEKDPESILEFSDWIAMDPGAALRGYG